MGVDKDDHSVKLRKHDIVLRGEKVVRSRPDLWVRDRRPQPAEPEGLSAGRIQDRYKDRVSFWKESPAWV
jgi:hypothetical protein